MFLALGAVCYLVAFVCGIIILISAFQEDVIQGVLCLCVPFYALYYAIVRFQHEKKMLILGGWLGATVLGAICMAIQGAMAGGAV